MNNIIYYLRLWQKCGLKVVFNLYFQKKKKNSIICISVKNFNHKIYLRTQTSDIQTFSDLIIGSHNHLDKIQLNKPEIIVDAGANIGITTVIYAKKFPNAHIYAIEPEASNYDILKKNTGKYSNITILQSALWYKHEKLTIKNSNADKWAFAMMPAQTETDSVDSITLDDLFSITKSNTIDYLKIDVEGAEKEIFENAAISNLKKIKMIGIELHDRIVEGCSKAFYARISQLNYKEIRNFTGDHIVEILP